MKEEMNLSDLWGGCIWRSSKPKSNGDSLRSKGDEELAEFLGKVMAGGYGMCAPGHYDCTGKDSCAPCWLDWLRKEADHDDA